MIKVKNMDVLIKRNARMTVEKFKVKSKKERKRLFNLAYEKLEDLLYDALDHFNGTADDFFESDEAYLLFDSLDEYMEKEVKRR